MAQTDTDVSNVKAVLQALEAPDPPPALVGFRLGGLDFGLRVPAELCEQLEAWYGGFRTVPNGGVDLRYHLPADVPPPALEALLEATDRYRTVQVVADSPALAPGEIAVQRWDFRCIARPDCRRVDAVLLARTAAAADAVARVAASLILPEHGGLLVHAASLAHAGKGYVFTGVSGSGKSTLSANSGGTILNDEITLLTVDENGVRVHGTPFYGDLKQAHNQQVPIGGLYILKKAETTLVENIPPGEQLARLLRNVICFRVDIEGFDLVHRVAERLLARCPLKRLHFTRDQDVLEVVAR